MRRTICMHRERERERVSKYSTKVENNPGYCNK
jgi:hypothetical protein